MNNKLKYLTVLAISASLLSCSKNHNDEPQVKDPVKKTQTVDATNYANWTYINLETGETQTLRDFNRWNYFSKGKLVETKEAQGSEKDITIKWHIAIHYLDIRTNNGQAIATTETEFSKVTEIPATGYTADEIIKNKLYTDMSGMMKGKIGVTETAKLNPVLCKWVKATPTNSMPPYIYEPTKLIYVVKFLDGSYAKLQFTNHQNNTGKVGHVTFSSEFVSK